MADKYVTFTLRVKVPSEIDNDTVVEIAEGAESDDRPNDAILRYLGGFVNGVESQLSDQLPEGWYARINDGKVHEVRIS